MQRTSLTTTPVARLASLGREPVDAKNRDQLRDSTLGSRVWTSFTFLCVGRVVVAVASAVDLPHPPAAQHQHQSTSPVCRRRRRRRLFTEGTAAAAIDTLSLAETNAVGPGGGHKPQAPPDGGGRTDTHTTTNIALAQRHAVIKRQTVKTMERKTHSL